MESKILQYDANVRHHSASSGFFAMAVKVTNYICLWGADIACYYPDATRWICLFYDFKQSRGSHRFKFMSHYLIVEVLVYREKFLEPSVYYTLIYCTKEKQKQKKNYSDKSHLEWSNARHVSAPIITILQTTAGTYQSTNCFCHVIYAQITSI